RALSDSVKTRSSEQQRGAAAQHRRKFLTSLRSFSSFAQRQYRTSSIALGLASVGSFCKKNRLARSGN
ncbi:MAG: hypothetical protein LBH06_06905, partial [Rikenellaceae bacterium]|nr:hypothetical protein [Rikenellaceae bacterium]